MGGRGSPPGASAEGRATSGPLDCNLLKEGAGPSKLPEVPLNWLQRLCGCTAASTPAVAPRAEESRPLRDLLEALQSEVQQLRDQVAARPLSSSAPARVHRFERPAPPAPEHPWQRCKVLEFKVANSGAGVTNDAGDRFHLGSVVVRREAARPLSSDREWRQALARAEARRELELARQRAEDLEEWVRYLEGGERRRRA